MRTGEVTKSLGLPWQNIFEVCVEADGPGAGSSRAEEAINIGIPTQAGLVKLGIDKGAGPATTIVKGTGRVPPPPSAQKTPSIPVNLGTQSTSPPTQIGTQKAVNTVTIFPSLTSPCRARLVF